jgi:hypothetical protein
MVRRKEAIQGIEARLKECSQELTAAGDSFNAAIEESMTTLQDRFTATHSALDDRLMEHVGREEVRQDNLERRFERLERRLVASEEKVVAQDDVIRRLVVAHERLRRAHNLDITGIPAGQVTSPFGERDDPSDYESADTSIAVPIPPPSSSSSSGRGRGIQMGGHFGRAIQDRRVRRRQARSVRGVESSSSSAASVDSSISYHPAPTAPSSAGSVVSGTLVDIDIPLDQVEVEYDFRRGVPLRDIPDSPPTTIAESFFEGPAVTQEEREEVDLRFQEADEELAEIVLNADADALRGGSF